MRGLARLSEGFAAWIDTVANAIVAAAGRLAFPHRVQAVEEEDGVLALRAGKDPAPLARLRLARGRVVGPVPDQAARVLRGSRVELLLPAKGVLFRPLELPRRAAEFLDGVVRSQIDRLTPWAADDAVFGFGPPAAAAADRIVVTVAASARAQVMPLVQAFADLGAASVAVSAVGPDSTDASVPIVLLDERTRPAADVVRVRHVLVTVLLLAALAAAVSIGSAAVIGADLAAQRTEVARKIQERRAAIRAGSATGAAPTALGRLERRKHETPSSVIVIEVLSQILPDHTYVTELRIEGDKLRLSGLTRDAPGLIRMLEQSPHFTRATFFAPTTRAPSDPGERFHIEAQIQPLFSPRS